MKENHQPCVTQTCRFDLISHPSSSFKKELNFSWHFLKFWTEQSFLRTYRSSVLDRAKICSGEKVTVQKGTHFFTDDKVSPSLTIFHLPFLSLQNTTRLKSGVTFTCFFCFLWKLFLSELICWKKQLYELWSPEIFHFASTVVPSAKKLTQNFRWILFEGTRGKQRVQVFRNGPRKLSFSG